MLIELMDILKLFFFYFNNHFRLDKVELSPEETPYISFRADHVGLRDSILNYGRVDSNGMPLITAFDDPGNPSASLPRHIEEYEDVDHHFFYKTLEEVRRSQNPVSCVSNCLEIFWLFFFIVIIILKNQNFVASSYASVLIASY